ncbi:cell envelope integrity protein CreD [Mucilaginibacter phyllosphaerae]|uniref:Cell envelope integrity protein CreD n=1 Tax=Mucilaginibacter phyllosphaerae TaxID=1812349 RepID=A0A4Y8AF45_9SPHI|nr:cell envelope integrity protein CreD [Mucilaginibacter phyllosphaerae]MBB3968982.1 inner membrane protein [Mucilaginibacter phyllosphaerae]TEW67397.1 cell envelope integrity protein CreD [Mucilaginibacter phyllosphaerae]GGH23123.1 cell envelope integrity protein CreD [Mucilaginibacter phyllosphaerae]
MIQEQQNPLKGIMDWFKESITVKLIFIGILILVLMIPSVLIGDLIRERSGRQDQIVNEVAGQWSGSQMVKGPVLIIPYRKIIKSVDVDKKESFKEVVENLYILPENLKIKANVIPEVLHRGMFETVVYNSSIHIAGNFAKTDAAGASLTPDQLMLDKARLEFSISDLKGLKNNPVINAAGMQVAAAPSFNSKDVFNNGLKADINLTGTKEGAFTFDYTLDLKGSQDLHFLHLGKTTDVEVSGKWGTPSFDGRYLPDTRQVDSGGFKANWRVLYYNRPYPQQWVNDNNLLTDEKKEANASFGVKLRLPVDQYQKITRTSKYAILIILLTFVSLFLTELIRKQRIHAFNYVLIGAAMIIYYTLLLSFSEQVGYNYAYLIASVFTVGLVSVFIASLLKNKGAAGLFALILSIIYTFIFVIIQLEDLALLIGSIALFVIIALLMYFSRKINWDKQ